MAFRLGERSLKKLSGVEDGLVRVVKRAIQISTVDFSVVDGVRSLAKQQQNVKDGVSQTLKSRHLTGHAVDIYPWVDGKTSHLDEHYLQLKDAMFKAAEIENVSIEWGGNWKKFIDKPHWQRPWSVK